jgi:putative transposase
MARLPRLSVPGLPHLAVQRGHDQAAVARDAVDRSLWRALLAEAASACNVAVHAFAIGGSRALLLATPAEAGALSRLMQIVGRRYTVAFNRRHGRSGTLWDGRFRAAVLEPARWLVPAMRLVEEAGATDPTDHLDSGPHHRGERPDALVTDHPAFWALGNTPFDREAAYRLQSTQPLSAADRAALEHAMLHGWALGSPAFEAELAGDQPRPVRPRRAGRPPRAA